MTPPLVAPFPPRRAAIIAAACAWIGTPYRHQASVQGVGADCLGLVRGVWRAVVGPEPEAIPAYAPEWADPGGADLLGAAIARWFTPVDPAAPGDVVLFRMQPQSPPRHAAILVAPDALVHAYWARAVVESRYSPWWRARVAAAFAFPGAEPFQGAASWPS